MRSRFALFVDAGYLIAAGGWAVTGKYKRNESICELTQLAEWLTQRATEDRNPQELLRMYWYDAAPNRQANIEQIAIAELPDTKLRLGHLTALGTQKGVDALLLSDLTTLSRERSIDTAIVLAGDGDFVEAVAQAQHHGTRVILWAIDTPQNTLSPDLRREADRAVLLSRDDLAAFFRPAPIDETLPVPASPASPPLRLSVVDSSSDLPVYATIRTDEALRIGRAFAAQFAGLASDSERRAILRDEPRLPGELHFRLIRFAIESAGLSPETRLAPDALRTVREGFWAGMAAYTSGQS